MLAVKLEKSMSKDKILELYLNEIPYGGSIYGIEAAERIPGVVVFHAGTSTADGTLRTSGGRVLGISAIGDTLQEALDSAYEAARQIRFDGARYRRDIGAKAFAASTTKT